MCVCLILTYLLTLSEQMNKMFDGLKVVVDAVIETALQQRVTDRSRAARQYRSPGCYHTDTIGTHR